MGKHAHRAGAGATGRLSAAALMRQAQAETGLTDWGDEAFHEGFGVLLDACAAEASLSPQGNKWLERDVLHWLTGRLHIQETLKQSPEILETPVERPLFIVGLPRTGSTLLHRLLGEDENGRVPLLWEVSRPTPPPKPEERLTDPRIKQVADEIEGSIHRLIPELASKHFVDVQAPEECNSLFQKSFTAYATGIFYHVPSYQAWIRRQDLTPSYRYYRKQVQLLCHHYPGRNWISKNPDHLLGLDAILDVFPDAAIVYLHRDLTEVFGSICSVQHTLINMWRSTPFAPREMGRIALEMMAPTVDQALEARRVADGKHFCDVQYADLVHDPIGTIEQIYSYFGYALSGASVDGMNRWLEKNRQNKHGDHRYTLEDFGLSTQMVQERLASYLEAFPM